MRKIIVINQKGGVAKTSTAINLAAGLARNDKKVLLVDLDPQGNIGTSIIESSDMGTYDFLFENSIFEQCITKAGTNMDVMTANESLTKAEFQLLQRKNPTNLIKEKFAKVKGYDYLIIDCAPSLGILNLNAMLYADEAIIPASTDPLGIDALKKIMWTIESINDQYLHNLQVTKIVPTLFDKRNKICKETLSKMQNGYYSKITNPVRVCSKVKEAPNHKKSIYAYDNNSRGAQDYRQLTQQVLQDEAFMRMEEEQAVPVSAQ
ncbi:hypothetical protein BVX95_01585 [archaeon D22]|nr:hypothetical protein BVX95_01585 [archaeon D22]